MKSLIPFLAVISILYNSTSADAQAPGNPSFSLQMDQDLLTHDFGSIRTGGNRVFSFSIGNIAAATGATSPISLTQVTFIGDGGTIQLVHDGITGLEAGAQASLQLVVAPVPAGEFQVSYLLEFKSDAVPEASTQHLAIAAFAMNLKQGDYNADRSVDGLDYDLWTATFGSTAALHADGNSDEQVNAADYSVWRDQFTSAGSGSIIAATESGGPIPVPEPSAIALGLCWLGTGLSVVRRFLRNLDACLAG